jgi:hypothetical protein
LGEKCGVERMWKRKFSLFWWFNFAFAFAFVLYYFSIWVNWYPRRKSKARGGERGKTSNSFRYLFIIL